MRSGGTSVSDQMRFCSVKEGGGGGGGELVAGGKREGEDGL